MLLTRKSEGSAQPVNPLARAARALAQKTRVAGEAAPPAGKEDGYRVSAHILKYYKTTEV